jgi:hypothetical protein
MAKLLVLANLELSFEIPDGITDSNELARQKEKAILRALRKIAAEDGPRVTGSVERLEIEAFSYASALEAEATGYYYNSNDERERRP